MENSKGFTLVELMIVAAIIGILAAIALPAYDEYKLKKQIEQSTIQQPIDRESQTSWN